MRLDIDGLEERCAYWSEKTAASYDRMMQAFDNADEVYKAAGLSWGDSGTSRDGFGRA